MTQAQAARTSLTEVRLLVEGRNRENQEQLEIARWLAWRELKLSPNIKPASKPASARAWFAFPWEEPLPEVRPEDCHVSAGVQKRLEEIVADFYARRAAASQSS